MVRARYVAALLALIFAGLPAVGRQNQKPAKKDLTPEEIVKAFTANETQLFDVWTQYYYRQIAEVWNTPSNVNRDEMPRTRSSIHSGEVVTSSA